MRTEKPLSKVYMLSTNLFVRNSLTTLISKVAKYSLHVNCTCTNVLKYAILRQILLPSYPCCAQSPLVCLAADAQLNSSSIG